jgi:hypothetical protein
MDSESLDATRGNENWRRTIASTAQHLASTAIGNLARRVQRILSSRTLFQELELERICYTFYPAALLTV